MVYTVTWKTSAEKDLAEIWLQAEDRAAVTFAANEMEGLLRRSPNSVGESRIENTRILVLAPLAMYYSVSNADHLVYVKAFW